MNTKHTPGPLHVFSVYAHHEVRTLTDTLVAVVNSREDARLFSAAPELLESLQAVYEMCDGYVPNTSKEVWRKAHAAIFKATGASHVSEQ